MEGKKPFLCRRTYLGVLNERGEFLVVVAIDLGGCYDEGDGHECNYCEPPLESEHERQDTNGLDEGPVEQVQRLGFRVWSLQPGRGTCGAGVETRAPWSRCEDLEIQGESTHDRPKP
jgi:hypothetical protein